MGKIYKLGEGAFKGIEDKRDLENLGYITGKKALELVKSYLCNNCVDREGIEKYKKYSKMLSDNLDKVQVGDGHGIRKYYKEIEVMRFIQNILNGNDIKVLPHLDIRQLKASGYISGKKALELIRIHLCNNSYENDGLEKYQKYSKKLSETLDKVQVGYGHGTRNYYKENEVIAFIQSILRSRT